MINGIDISVYQGDVNFDEVRKQVDFVIARATYGVGYVDGKFTQNRDALRGLNIPHGFYHYAYPEYNAPEAEAEWFVDNVIPVDGELLCLDFEEDYGGDITNWCVRFLIKVEELCHGYKPLLYINSALMQAHDWNVVIARDYGLWLATWNLQPEVVVPATPWPVVAIHQYSPAGIITGIIGSVDLDVFFGDVETFKKYGYKQPQALPQVEPITTPVVEVAVAQIEIKQPEKIEPILTADYRPLYQSKQPQFNLLTYIYEAIKKLLGIR